jgi:hypothetical protein
MTDDQLRLYATYEVTARNRDGDVVQHDYIENTGSVTMEDISTNALVNGVDEIEVSIQEVETRRGDTVVQRIERDTD